MGTKHPRAAYSLIEVILATAILVGSTIVLVQLAGIGREHAWSADDITRAQVLCQNKLNELLAGIEPLQPVEGQAFEYDDQWTYTVQVEPLDVPGLSRISVTVTEITSDPTLASQTDQNPRSFRLVRWTRQTTGSAGEAIFSSPAEPSSPLPETFDDAGSFP